MTRLKKHFITGTAKNVAEALSMAMQLNMSNHRNGVYTDITGVQQMVQIIDSMAIKLRNICEHYEYKIGNQHENKN